MKMRLTFKDPDVLCNAANDFIYLQKKSLMKELRLSESGAEAEAQERYKKMDRTIGKYMEYGEYITVEFDDETETARVVQNNE